ncbi:YT521-B-like domain-containing protein [Phanerochaete sordida]|uniref:YT521-B-like domain-containing protein n=1 Tax=Phanerochaete sordida TaxID=48140 RepID=A0A9P3G551_9APHY|nr:YT521-B-like domain-containing protein [Phanerochaete sordida]
MSSAPDSGKPPGSSRGRSYSNASRRGSSSRQTPTSQAFQAHYPSLPEPPVQQPSYHAQYQSASTTPYSQRAPYGSGPYTISPPLQPGSMVGQPTTPQYSYPSHPGLLAQDPSMQPQNILGYSPNTHMPHTPVYTYPSQPEAASSSSQTYGSSPTAAPGLYSSAPSSHALLTPGSSQQSYATSGPYAARYPSPTFAYPPHSFGHSGNTLYQGQYSYQQQYRPPIPAEQDQGTWWYLPPGTRPAPSPHYLVYDNPYPTMAMYTPPLTAHESEPFNAPQSAPATIPSTLYPMSPRHQAPFSATTPLQPQLQRPPGPDPPPPLTDPSARPVSEPPSSLPPSSPATMSRADRQQFRRPYHPNPPANRSEWVMWAGNVPADATHDELWRFFNRSPTPVSSSSSRSNLSDTASLGSVYGGVSSIHLISRSNCAFVNFESEGHLTAAIAHFNGQSLRPGDPRCPRLVCRVRAREDDLRAGVGGQRGAGIHVRYIKEQRQKQKQRAATSPEVSSSEPPSSSPEDPAPLMANLSLSSDEEALHARRAKKPAAHSSSSGSYASTNSSLLSQYFPKRYFILKSLTQFDLDLSVEKGIWATQRHNEGILDQAYRTSKEVYLIFGVNKSGEFYGYARMAGPVLRHQGEQREGQNVAWASRSSLDSPTRRTSSSAASPASPRSIARAYFSPADGARYSEDSPLPMESPEPPRPPLDPQSRIPRHGELSYQELVLKPKAASGTSAAESAPDAPEEPLPGAPEAAEEPKKDDGPVWGDSFPVEWIRTDRLPFYRTRHLRNPWNHDREIKVSRDGTELEPSVGQALLEEWDKPDPQPPTKPSPAATPSRPA